MTRLITPYKAQACLDALTAQFKPYVDAGYSFTLHEPGTHTTAWSISADGMGDWTMRAFVGGFDEEVYHLAADEPMTRALASELAQQAARACPPGVHAEPVNDWCLGLYFTDEAASPAIAVRWPASMSVADFVERHGIAYASDDAAAFAQVLSTAPGGTDGIAHVLAVAHAMLDGDEPMGLAERSATLTPVEAVSLASELAAVGLYALDDNAADAAALIRTAVIGRFEDEPLAALCALDATGAAGVGCVPTLPVWTQRALVDHESFSVCEHTLTRVATALANERPGMKWRHVPGLDFVVYQTQDIDYRKGL